MDAAVAADGRTDHLIANGRTNSAEKLTAQMLAKAPFDAAGETCSYDHGLSGRLRSRGNLSQDNAVAWIDRLLTAIDDLISAQVNAILHHPHFQRLRSEER